jgi:hypothetical protein
LDPWGNLLEDARILGVEVNKPDKPLVPRMTIASIFGGSILIFPLIKSFNNKSLNIQLRCNCYGKHTNSTAKGRIDDAQ